MSERRVYPLRSVLDRELSVSSSGVMGIIITACRSLRVGKLPEREPRRAGLLQIGRHCAITHVGLLSQAPRCPQAALPRAPTAPSPRRSLYSMLTLPVVQTFPRYRQRPRAKGFVSSRPVHPVAPRPMFAE